MACFLVPATEAVVSTIAANLIKNKEGNTDTKGSSPKETELQRVKVPFSRKLKWLSNLLWGGSVLLAFEHVWHGEIVPWFPFLTAAADPADAAEMLHEMAAVGGSMAALVTVIWIGMLAVTSVMEKKALLSAAAPKKGA